MNGAVADFDQLSRILSGPLPGLPAQLAMVPIPRPGNMTYRETETTSLKAGVLILLYPRAGGERHIVFIRRPGTVARHKDQIAFPGGQIEPGEDFVRAALREAEEEIGVPPVRIRIAGALTPLYIPPSNFSIYPAVGLAQEPLEFVPYPEEVAEIIEVPLARLLDPGTVRRETWTLGRGPVLVPFYAFGPHKIWGATAMVLAEFLAILGPGAD